MREFKIIRSNPIGDGLITDYEMFADMDAAEAWGDAQNARYPGSIVDIELMTCNEEFKYEW